MKTLLAVLLSALLTISTHLTAAAETTHPNIKLKILSGRPIVDGVYCNGKGPFRFLIDTGNHSNQIDAHLAQKLGLAPTFQVQLYTPSGSSRVPGTKVDKLTLGSSEATGQAFLITSLEGVHALSPDIQGILGQEFLSHFDYTLDFQHHELTLGDSSVTGAHVPVRMVDGLMAVPTSQGDLVLDSGADTLFLFRESSHSASAQISAASGSTASVSLEKVYGLQIGERLYHPAGAVFHPVPAATHAGLLPANLFHAIFICNSAGYVVFDPATR
jgi:Aspartyl protease